MTRSPLTFRQDLTVYEKPVPTSTFEGRRGNSRPGFAGKPSANCVKRQHTACTKLDCPCECHGREEE